MTQAVFVNLVLASAFSSFADEPKTAEPSASEISLEVQALRAIASMKLAPDQEKLLRKLAKDAAEPARERKTKASKEYVQMLADLRNALVAGDNDRADELQEKLDELTETEKPELDEGIEVTDAARKHAPTVFKSLKAPQVAFYITQVVDEIEDPGAKLIDALDKARGLKLSEWKEQRDEMAQGISVLLAGVDAKANERYQDKIIALLSKARGLKDEEFKTQRPDLENEARELAGEVGSTDVLRHKVEHALAELLSNPRLAAALQAREP
jgi:hypothetical protein